MINKIKNGEISIRCKNSEEMRTCFSFLEKYVVTNHETIPDYIVDVTIEEFSNGWDWTYFSFCENIIDFQDFNNYIIRQQKFNNLI